MTVDGPAAAASPADDTPSPVAPKPPASAAATTTTTVATTTTTSVRSHPEGNVKDTVESILVAFILAFVFRAFVVEAFVIPTGSMAPTLLGAHMSFRCADCGYDFAVNYPTSKAGNDLAVPPESGTVRGPIVCPNCGYRIPENGPSADDRTGNVPVHYGDRILVLKYRYLVGGGPRRWDVVVFKSPDPVPPSPNYTTNYIKRLVGRPGESVMILDGDIYVSTAPPPPPDAGEDAHKAFLKTFQIQRKPGYAQDAVWRVVYDNDHLPHLTRDELSPAWRQPWEPRDGGPAVASGGSAVPGGGWDVGQNLAGPARGRTREFRFDAAAGGSGNTGSGTIEFNPDANPATHAFTDFIAYDQWDGERSTEHVRPVKNVVGDLKLSFVYRRESGDGPLELSLSKRRDRFAVRLTRGQAVLTRTDTRTGETKEYPPVAVPALAAAAAATDGVKLDFANVDYRVSLRVDGREVLATGDEYGPAGDGVVALAATEEEEGGRGGDRANPPTVRVSAAGQRCALQHVRLDRDVFYVNRRSAGGNPAVLRGTSNAVVTLGPEEYFTLGDNQLISKDGRMWEDPVRLPGEDLPYVEAGRVPARFLLGKAFFVYWPAGHRPLGSSWGIVPNFGDMRFIH